MKTVVDTLPPFANSEVRHEFQRYQEGKTVSADLETRIHVYRERIQQLELHSENVLDDMRIQDRLVRLNRFMHTEYPRGKFTN
jgi:hypothetical protein